MVVGTQHIIVHHYDTSVVYEDQCASDLHVE